MHELTHLDALAKSSGLTAPSEGEDAGRHGTGDYQQECQLSGARDWKKKWEKNKVKLASPDYNAESYAAAATGMCNLYHPDWQIEEKEAPPPPQGGKGGGESPYVLFFCYY